MKRPAALALGALALALALLWLWPSPKRSSVPADGVSSSEQPSRASKSKAEVRVRVRAGGAALGGVRVFIHAEPERPSSAIASATSGADGVAVLRDVPLGSWQLLVVHPELAPRRRPIEIVAERVELEVALERGVRIEGTIVDARGQAVSGAMVRVLASGSDAEHGRQTSDTRGAFVIAGLDVGTYRLYVHSGRHRPLWEGPIALGEHGASRRLEIRLEDGRFLAGQVVDAERKPVAGAHVGAADEGSSLVSADDRGRFELGGLGDAAVNIYATAPGYGPTHLSGLRPGSRNVEIVLERAASVDGTIALAAPAPKSMVSVCRHDVRTNDELCVARRLYEPAETRFELDGLPVGKFEIVIEADGHRAARVPVSLSPGRKFTVPLVSLEIAARPP